MVPGAAFGACPRNEKPIGVRFLFAGMNQRRSIGICLLVLAVVAAVLAILGAYNFAKGEGEGMDAAFTLAALLATATCGAWAYHFMHDKEGPASAQPTKPAQ